MTNAEIRIEESHRTRCLTCRETTRDVVVVVVAAAAAVVAGDDGCDDDDDDNEQPITPIGFRQPAAPALDCNRRRYSRNYPPRLVGDFQRQTYRNVREAKNGAVVYVSYWASRFLTAHYNTTCNYN